LHISKHTMKQGGITIPALQMERRERENDLLSANGAASKSGAELSSPSGPTMLCPLASSALGRPQPSLLSSTKTSCLSRGGSEHLQSSSPLLGTSTSPLPRSSRGEATRMRASLDELELPLRSPRPSGSSTSL